MLRILYLYAIKLGHYLSTLLLNLMYYDSVSSDSLSEHMDTGGQKLWSCRANKQIVLVDSESKSTDAADKTSLPVIILKDAIYKVETKFFKFTVIHVLLLLSV